MSVDYLRTLGWLPRVGEDFKARCRELKESSASDPVGARLRALATQRLDANQLQRVAGLIQTFRAQGRDLKPLTRFRLGFIGNGTLDFIEPALVASAARHGIALECIRSGYDQVMQEALDPSSTLCRASPDAVLVALDYRALPLHAAFGDSRAADEAVASAIQQLETIRAALERNCGALTIFQSLATPSEPLFGSFDRVLPGTLRQLIAETNRALAALVAQHPAQCVLLDVAALAETVGSAEWFSPAQWNIAKLPFAGALVPLYAEHAARLVAALRGKTRRCLVLDLDNTVWGGVIGDDGIDGIKIAQGDAVGEAFLSVQQMALSLRARGVVLAVCSKNEDAIARLPFRNHPEMLLREEHIAVFQANWKDKASNIVAIAETLNLGLDSFVFLDDNPAERALVRSTLPDVAIPELPEDPALYPLALSAGGYFEATTLSEEDKARAAFYEGNARRVALKAEVADMDAFLKSLQMEITFEPFDEVGRSRITQLINKSNQFNLTTRRYTEAEVARVEADPAYFTLQVRLSDNVGDNGMISVIICREASPNTWHVDTWLMSCRVLGRQVEKMVLMEIARHAERAGVRRIVGEYLPTDRNMMVKDHYAKLGFSSTAERSDGSTEWEITLPVAISAAPMTVKRRGFAEESAGAEFAT